MKLNIQLFASGTVDNFQPVKGTSSATLQGKIDWSSVGDVANNQSTVTTVLWVRRTDNYTSSPTSGKSWKGTVKVGSNTEHKFTGFSSSVSVGSSWVKLATYTDVVKHNTDGTCTITISGSVTGPSGTSLASATSRGSKTVELDRLHKIPDNIQYTMIETNQKLIDAGITDNIFVKGLSIKSFNISGDTYDDTTIKEYAIFNRLNVFSTTTLPVIVDLTQNELQIDTTYVSKIPIKAQIIDSFDTAGYSETILYDYVLYNKITLIETSTTAKRNGQTSGKVKLNVNGNLYNGVVGNVDQSTYKPIIKYKFWQTGTEEPISYDYEIASDNITIENGVFSVSNYEIGSSVETDINWFNPDNAYKVKIYVEDNFTNYESQEKSIAVGESTWTEYKNRVDFKAITTRKMAINGFYDEKNDSPLQIYDDEGNLFINSAMTICNQSSNVSKTISKTWTKQKFILPTLSSNVGNIFTFENGAIKVNKDCRALISLTGLTKISSFGVIDVGFWIVRNGGYILGGNSYIQTTAWESVSITPILFELKKDDIVEMYFQTGVTGTLEFAAYLSTQMTIQQI